jgi:serine protease inhibitor
MKNRCTFNLLIVSLLILLASCCGKLQGVNDSILKETDNLPKTGILKEKNGYIYLKLNNEYIHKLCPIIQKFDYKAKKPPYFRAPESVGSHISVMYETETSNFKVKEINQEFDFSINKVKIVKSAKINYYVLEVESPRLEQLRIKYGLSRFLKGYKFHTTIAIFTEDK